MHASTLNKHRWNVNLLFVYFFHKGDSFRGEKEDMIHLRDGYLTFPKRLELLRRELPKVGTEQLGALDVVGAVQLLVNRVGAVRGAAHGEQQNVLLEGILEGQGDGDGATLTGQIGLDLEDALNSVGSGN